MSEDKIIAIIQSHVGRGKGSEYELAVCNIMRDINGARQREFDGEMTELGERNYVLISQAVKDTGDFDPNEIFFMFEERLYIHEAETIEEFLQWIVDGGYELKHGIVKVYHRGFGHGNYEEKFQEFLMQR